MSESIQERANRWVVAGDTGISSKAIWAHMMGVGHASCDRGHPSDPGDLGRCLRLLFIIPEWTGRIQEMKQYTPGWAGLVEQWATISALMAEEVGINWHKCRSAPRTYTAMKLAIADGYRKDPGYECTFDKDGTLRSYSKKSGGPSGFSLGGDMEMRFGE